MSTPKKYINFPAATYDPTRILLQADPVTGALYKTTLPAFGGGSILLASAANAHNNTTTVDETVLTGAIPIGFSIPAGTVIELFAFIGFLTGTGTKTINMAFGSQNIASYTSVSSANIQIDARIVFNTTTQYQSSGKAQVNFSFSSLFGPGTYTFNPAIANDLTIKIKGAAANDIKFWYAYIKLIRP